MRIALFGNRVSIMLGNSWELSGSSDLRNLGYDLIIIYDCDRIIFREERRKNDDVVRVRSW